MNVYYDNFSTVEPYNNMYERCPSEPPNFYRDTNPINGC